MVFGGFWLRVVAYVIDTIILIIIGGIIGVVLGVGLILSGTVSGPEDPAMSSLESMGNIVGIMIGWIYFAVMESSQKQATIGKMAMGLTVTNEAGAKIGFARATGRYFAKFVSAIILLIGFIMVAFTERKQGLHDLMASTLVVKARPGEPGVDSKVFG